MDSAQVRSSSLAGVSVEIFAALNLVYKSIYNIFRHLQHQVLGPDNLILVVSFTYFHFQLFLPEISMKPRLPIFGVHGGRYTAAQL